MRELDTSKYLYSFIGGEYNGKIWRYAALEVRNIIDGYSADLSELRARGVLVYRAELDNQPLIDGYFTPMYDGVRYIINGAIKHSFECSDEEKANNEPLHMIRYETQEVYNMMSR